MPGDGESCYHALRNGRGARHPHAVMLRNPTDHVVSQWLYCSQSAWGRAVVRESPHAAIFQRWAHLHARGKQVEALQGWLDWFVDQPAQPEHFNCYSPDNMQARALSCTSRRGFGSHGYSPPNLSVALASVASIENVGVLELHRPSMCLWFYRTHGFLPSTCRASCDRSSGRAALSPGGSSQVSSLHGKYASTLQQAPQLMARIHRLTALDQLVYAAAVRRLERELLETERRTGTPLICREQLRLIHLRSPAIDVL